MQGLYKNVVLSLAGALALLACTGCPSGGLGVDAPKEGGKDGRKPLPPFRDPGKATEYLFCFWNVENLFDDKDDRLPRPDDAYDKYFSGDEDALKAKLDKLAGVLMKMNGGKGPDVLCAAEVESERAAQLLMGAMNAKLDDKLLHYREVVYADPKGKRSISVPMITRLPVEGKARILRNGLRIQETKVVVNGHELVVISSHWSSRISDKKGDSRARYADQIHGRFRAMYKSNPKVDFLVCGDFNDNPDDKSVTEHLLAVGTLEAMKAGGDVPKLFDCFAKAYADGKGTHYYRNKAYVFDHICVSPGLLDGEGWSCLVETAAIVPEIKSPRGVAPNRFGGPGDRRPYSKRGASDHYPVTVRLRVAAKKGG